MARKRRGFEPVMRIAAEGWLLLLPVLAGVLAAIAAQRPMLGGALIVLALALMVVFHEPDREIPPRALGIVAPVDGWIESVTSLKDIADFSPATRIRMQVYRLGGYAIRAPVEGEVTAPKAELDGRPTALIKTDEGDHVMLVCRSGSLLGARPVRIPFGQRIGQGRRCGARRLASKLDILISGEVRVEVPIGQRVRSGSDVIATFLRRS